MLTIHVIYYCRIFYPKNMTFLRTTILFILGFQINKLLCDVDPNLTVDNANAYIEQNKDTVVQTYRLKYHAMAPIGWVNDPNGFIFYKGEYHLFYQTNPYGTLSNKIHWGHKKSKDLVQWEDLPVALAPDHDYDSNGVWSGSAIEKDGNLYAIYTGNLDNRQVQCVAESEDGLRFTKVEENPVIDSNSLPSNAKPEDFRDPKVFKRNDLYYVVVVSKTVNEAGQVLLYQSSDLIKWELKSTLLEGTRLQGSMWECPDLFELDGKDVLLLSAVEMPRSGNDYNNLDSVLAFIGEVDWNEGKFRVESMTEIDHGMDIYATQTTTDEQGRRIMIAWMNMWGRSYATSDLGHGWTGAMILPRELHIQDGFLVQNPISELADFHDEIVEYSNETISNEIRSFDRISGEVGVLELKVNLEEANSFSVELRAGATEATLLTYDTSSNEITLDRQRSGIAIIGLENPQVTSRKVLVPLNDGILKLKVLLDKSSVEVFVNDGKETFTATIYPTMEDSNGINFKADGIAVIEYIKYFNLKL